MTHTSGIRHYSEGEIDARNPNVLRHYDSIEAATRFWRDDALLFTPGTQFSYSSFAVNLLQAVIEAASGQPFEAYMREHVWKPADMADSQFDVPWRFIERRGRAYERDEQTSRLVDPVDEDLSYKYASGGMLGSVEDLCHFGYALNSGVLLQPATLAEMYRLQLAPEVTHFGGGGSIPPSEVQALLFRISQDPRGHLHAGHSGQVKGAVSQFYNYFRDDVVVAVYMNADSDDVDLADVAETLAGMFDPSTAAASR